MSEIVPGTRFEKADGSPAWFAVVVSINGDTMIMRVTIGNNSGKAEWSITSTLEQIECGHLQIVN